MATGGLTKRYRPPAQDFARKYTVADVALLAETDALHDTLSGPATQHLMQRAGLRGDPLSEAGVDLGGASLPPGGTAAGYRARRQPWTKTRPTGIAIGERRAPQPDGRPDSLRIDRVPWGDEDGGKGVYHIHAVDCVTRATQQRGKPAATTPPLPLADGLGVGHVGYGEVLPIDEAI